LFKRSVSVTIARPIEEVFDFIADARNRPQWDQSVDSEELTSPEPIGVGSTVRTKLRSMGRDYEIDWEIIEHQAPSRQRIVSTSGPFPTTLVYGLESNGDSSTQVDFSVTGNPGGALRLIQPLIARGTQSNLDKGFARLQRLLETGSPD
jgi:carbon monoxide dehydrogenase subunit G